MYILFSGSLKSIYGGSFSFYVEVVFNGSCSDGLIFLQLFLYQFYKDRFRIFLLSLKLNAKIQNRTKQRILEWVPFLLQLYVTDPQPY